MRAVRYGSSAWLVVFADALDATAMHCGRQIALGLRSEPPPGLINYVPAFTSVLLEFEPSQWPNEPAVLDWALRWMSRPAFSESAGNIVEIPVEYRGPDLERVARWNGLSCDEVVALHTAPVYQVVMLGFAPGFPYLAPLDPRLRTPRLSVPRARVPAGSVAIGGEHTGIYSVDSPGGWNLIGETQARLFDAEKARGLSSREDFEDSCGECFLLAAGDQVRFVAIRGGAGERGE